jgi:eukaryotic-like serine/threonine-protein kinase
MIDGLDRERWNQLTSYLDEALELPLPARAAWLESHRARDARLAADLETLLADYDRAAEESFLEHSLAPRATLVGQVLGAYTLRELIGCGGMGSVWRAERSDGRYQAATAVKLLNASLIGREAESRFRREGVILGRLRHPNIAHLVDAGVSPAGQPYLVLEYVQGDDLLAFSDRRRLGIPARLRLFRDVLAAVAHAHANLIVHRDLKPSNVLVDAGGSVKLLDFGVAKLLSTGADEGATVTLEDGRWLTPEYAAPEQLAGGDITTASDVFSLGVLLYQLLAGCHPAGSLSRDAPGPLVRAVLERDPPRLSATVPPGRKHEAAARDRAALRATSPDGLRRALRGDLETIVAKALKKDPGARYASVQALDDDLRRHLEHIPIAARPDTLRYRAAKFVRRNRLPVALVAVVLAALTAGLVGTTWQARAAARERDLALVQLDRADNVEEFTAFLLGRATPGDDSIRVRDLLALGEELAERRSQHDRTLAVDMLVSIGDIYVGRDHLDSARRTLQRAYGLAAGADSARTRADSACSLGRVVAMSGDAEQGLRLVEEGLAQTSDEARFDRTVAGCLMARAAIAVRTYSPDLLSASAAAALQRLDRRPSSFPVQRAGALHMIALGQRMAGKTAEADRSFADAYDQLGLIGRQDSMDAAGVLANWASNTALTSPRAALDQHTRVIALWGGVESGDVPVPSLVNYGLVLNQLARFGEARAVLERTAAAARKHGSADGLRFASVRLAHACLRLQDLDCARSSLEVAEAGLPAQHHLRGDVLRERALLAEAEHGAAEALPPMLEALALHGRLRAKSATLVESLIQVSRLELARGRAPDAEGRARSALAEAESLRGGMPHSSWVGRSLLALADAKRAQGKDAAARDLALRAVEQMVPTLGSDHPALLEARRLGAR